MMPADSLWIDLAFIFILFVILFGMGLCFARASYIERNALVGGLTSLTGVIAGTILYASRNLQTLSDFQVLLITLLSVSGFVLGRGLDRLLGPKDLSTDTRRNTLGSDLSD